MSLVSPRRTSAVAKASSRDRVDLGPRLPGVDPQGALLTARSLGNESTNLRIPLSAMENLDDDVVSWLRRAYEENS